MDSANSFTQEELQIVKKAVNIIRDPAARNVTGAEVHPINSNAVCWCSIGAIYHAALKTKTSSQPGYITNKILRKTEIRLKGTSVASFNDKNKHKTVIQFWDNVIAEEEANLKAENQSSPTNIT